MRGLSDEERLVLEGWRRRDWTVIDPRRPDHPAHRLMDRGLIDMVPVTDNPAGAEPVVTPDGELALRVDAAARAQGLWP